MQTKDDTNRRTGIPCDRRLPIGQRRSDLPDGLSKRGAQCQVESTGREPTPVTERVADHFT